MSGISALFVNDSHSNVKIEIILTFLTAKFLEHFCDLLIRVCVLVYLLFVKIIRLTLSIHTLNLALWMCLTQHFNRVFNGQNLNVLFFNRYAKVSKKRII